MIDSFAYMRLMRQVHSFELGTHEAWPSPVIAERDGTLTGLLLAAGAGHGGGAALVLADGETVSHGALHARANRIARALAARGIGPECTVALLLDDPAELPEAVLGVLAAGAAFLPLDPASPPARLDALLSTARPDCLLTTEALAARLPNGLPEGTRLLCPGAPGTAAALADLEATPLTAQDRTAPLHPDQAAYVLHTSGSTGTPKSVVISQRAIATYVRTLSGLMGEDAAHMPLFTAPTFDLTLTSLLVPLATGGTLTLCPPGRPEEALAGIFAPASPARSVKLTPSHIALLDALAPAPAGTPRRLRLAIAGGEALTPAHLRLLHAHAPGLRVLNEYGPTEATIGAVAAFVTLQDGEGGGPLPIGRPYPGTGAHVLDDRLQPCPVGVPGELYLSGPGLARGYRGQPGLTAERFIANPAGPPGARLYRTGDIAAWRADGQLVFHARADDQVKIRGHRVEPGEIEALLCDLPGIAQAAVKAVPDPAGGLRLAAWYAPEDAPEPAAVRAQLAARLPAHMLPDAFTRLARLALTAHGKIDRAALPDPRPGNVSGDDAVPYTAPVTEEEHLVCTLMEDLTGRSPVGTEDHFFRLGGHSLLAARLAARIRQATGKTLPIRTIFQTPRIKDIAKALKDMNSGEVGEDDGYGIVFPIRPAGDRPPLFCLHPVIGLCWPYLSLLPFTSERQPIYGLQAPGLRPGSPLPERLCVILDACLAGIARICPDGPVRLLGWSFGGVLAHLMATRLQTNGRVVDRLVLVDAFPPWRPPGGVYPADNRPDGVWRDLAFGLDIDVPASKAQRQVNAAVLLELATAQGHPASAFSLAEIRHFADIMSSNTQFMAGMAFGVYRGDILFVAGDDRPAGFDPERMNPGAWQPYCEGVIHTETVHSTHNRMLHPDTLEQMALLKGEDFRYGS